MKNYENKMRAVAFSYLGIILIFTMYTIELLNGEIFKHDEILELMKDDEFYYGYLGKAASKFIINQTTLRQP